MKQFMTLIALSLGTSLCAQTLTTYTMADGLPSNNLRDVSIDQEGNVWLATQQGVAMFDGSMFTVHNTTNYPGLANNDVVAIAAASNGDVWVGTDFGASVFDGSTYTTYTTADGLGENQVTNIKQAPNGDVWIGTLNGVTRYSDGVFTAFGNPDIPFGGVVHIAFDTNGDVWLSGGLGGVIIYDGNVFSTMTTAQGLVSNKIRSIAFSSGSNKWVGTAKGISVFDASDEHSADHTTPFLLPPPDTLNPVTDVGIDSQGHVWAAVYVDYLVTEGGVCVFDGMSWVQFEMADGLAGPNVRRMAIDAEDDVWVTTSTGLTEISYPFIGINEAMKRPGFALYPNPAATELNVVMDGSHLGALAWQVFDAQMRLVRNGFLVNGMKRLDLTGMEPGIYLFMIGSGVRKFVVN